MGDELLRIVEHRPAREPELAVFTMINRYFTCQSDQEPGEQQLEDYEVELGLAPVWVRPDLALRANEGRCADRMVPYWVVRDTLALRMMVAGEV